MRIFTIAMICFLTGAPLSAQNTHGKQTVTISQIGNGVWRLRFGAPEKFSPERFRIEEARLKDLEMLEEMGDFHPIQHPGEAFGKNPEPFVLFEDYGLS